MIGECHKCGEQVQESTQWDVSMALEFICENCNKARFKSHKSYLENAAWLKEHNRKVSKQLNS